MLGWNFLDPAAGLLVSGLIIRAGLQTGYQRYAINHPSEILFIF